MKIKKKLQEMLDELIILAVDEWGCEAQINMVAEESVELAHAALKLNRSRGDYREKRLNAIEEMVDVLLMINQLAYILEVTDSEMNKKLEEKINRTFLRLKERVS